MLGHNIHLNMSEPTLKSIFRIKFFSHAFLQNPRKKWIGLCFDPYCPVNCDCRTINVRASLCCLVLYQLDMN